MADKPTTGAGDRDPYFAQQIQSLQGSTSSLSSQLTSLNSQLSSINSQIATINARLGNLEKLASK